MKPITYLLPFLILVIEIPVFGQRTTLVFDSDIKIDPRQYIQINYRKTSTQAKFIPIWNWEETSAIPNQKVRLLDVNGEVRIEFIRSGIIKNNDFEGTVSLEAEISGSNGTRKIEVNPYSEIGVQRMPIGIKSEPPSVISRKLINMIKELKDAQTNYVGVLREEGRMTDAMVSRNLIIQERVKDFKKLTNNFNADITKTIIDDATEIQGLILQQYKFDDLPSVRNNEGSIYAILKKLIQTYNTAIDEDEITFVSNYTYFFDYCKAETDIILQYLTSFDNSGEDASKAFLSLIDKDDIGYKVLKNNFLEYKKQLDQIDLKAKNIDSVLHVNRKLILQSSKALASLSTFKGSIFEHILLESMGNTQTRSSISRNSRKSPDVAVDSINRNNYYKLLDDSLQTISDKVSYAAGRLIYKKLVYATIDLGKSGAKSGEVLNIYVTWILNGKKDSLANSPRLPIGKYFLSNTGWNSEVTDMFSLVKRIHEPTTTSSNVSPTNFKGAGGAVLMWTYHKEDVGLKIVNKENKLTVSRKNKFINFLEPSVGLNVSYLDFSTDKDVELGVGLQLGLFKNKIFFGYGTNLQLLSPANQSPTYFFIGFSFAKLSELFKDAPSVNSQ